MIARVQTRISVHAHGCQHAGHEVFEFLLLEQVSFYVNRVRLGQQSISLDYVLGLLDELAHLDLRLLRGFDGPLEVGLGLGPGILGSSVFQAQESVAHGRVEYQVFVGCARVCVTTLGPRSSHGLAPACFSAAALAALADILMSGAK